MRRVTNGSATAFALLAALTLVGACGASSKPRTSPGPSDTAVNRAAASSVPTSGATLATTSTPSNSSTNAEAAKALTILSQAQHQPRNINIFSSQFLSNGFLIPNQGVYPNASAMAPNSNAKPTEAQVTSQLQGYLHEQFGSDHTKIDNGVTLFHDAKVQRMIPDPTLRAAFVSMTGTTFEPVINDFLNSGVWTGMKFGPLTITTALAQSQADPATLGKRITVISTRYRDEAFPYLVALLGHEDQHADGVVSNTEEAILNEETGMVMTEVLAKHPELAYANTELARRMNDYAMAFLNSRHPNSAQNVIIAPDGLGLYPGSTDTNPDMWSNFKGGGSTPQQPVTGTILGTLGITGRDGKFDQATAARFETMSDPKLDPVTRLRVSVLLGLTNANEIAQKLAITAQEVTDTFQLQPILDVVASGQHAP